MNWKDKAEIGLLAKYELRIDEGSFKIREYANRLAVSRSDGERLTWEQLQAVKNSVLGSGEWAIEIYPAESRVVNLRHTRHLWRMSNALTEIVRFECQHPEFE